MPIDPDVASGATLPEIPFAWNESDVLLYHLAVGAGAAPGDNTSEQALRWTVEGDRLQVLPSFGIVTPTFHLTEPPQELPGCDIDLTQVLHGTQSIELHGPIATSGSATVTTRITEVWDKGSAAVIVQEGTATTTDGTDLWSTRSSMFVRGEGGWGGERGPSVARLEVPERDPDLDASYPTTPQQALLYRLCGDRNPLHSDPAFAKAAGFPAPILHGLCSLGIALRIVVDGLLDGDAAAVRRLTARFAGVVFPGEAIRVRAWSADEEVRVEATIGEGQRAGSPVLADCVVSRA
jgi:acyl dehydratase